MLLISNAWASGVTTYCHYDTVSGPAQVGSYPECPTNITSLCFVCNDLVGAGQGGCAFSFSLTSSNGHCKIVGTLDVNGWLNGCGSCPEGSNFAQRVSGDFFWSQYIIH
jgi:hypothetical protein